MAKCYQERQSLWFFSFIGTTKNVAIYVDTSRSASDRRGNGVRNCIPLDSRKGDEDQ